MTLLKAKHIRCKKCANCKESFKPSRNFQSWCSIECAVAIAKAKQARQKAQEATKERAEHAKAKESLRDKAWHMKAAQQAFNAMIRERDKDEPCISCGRFHEGKYDAGHYRSVGSNPALRFEPLNCWRQCVPCNRHKSGNAIEYRINLVKRIGAKAVEWLEGPHEPKRYTIEDLVRMKAEFRVQLRAMQKACADNLA